jgi:ABC-type dipeptide/oligopeptide/nickel transport system permease component
VGVVLVVLVTLFFISRLLPVDPCLAVLGDKATDAHLARCQEQHHLNHPPDQQFKIYMAGLFRGDAGVSIRTGRPVIEDLVRPLAATIELSLVALVMTIVPGLAAGLLAARFHNRLPDWGIRLFTVMANGVPLFLLGLALKELFHSHLHWLPRTSRLDAAVMPADTHFYLLENLLRGNGERCINALQHLLLPAATLALYFSANLVRIVRVSMLDVLPRPYVLAARARGVPEQQVILKHTLKRAMIPVLTIIGLTAGHVLSGTVLTEVVFSWPGLGMYAIEAARHNDVPSVAGVTLLAAMVYPTTYIIIEGIQYGLHPPR